MSIEHVYIGMHYCKTSNFNYMNFRVHIQVLALNINHPAGHLLTRPVHHDHCHVHGRNRPLSRKRHCNRE